MNDTFDRLVTQIATIYPQISQSLPDQFILLFQKSQTVSDEFKLIFKKSSH